MKKTPHNNIDFIALASHQLRTPLTIMKGYLSMILKNDFGKITEPDLRKALQTVYLSNERLINLVENLLSKSRLDVTNLQLTNRTVNIQKLVSSIIFELEPKARDKGLKIQIILPKNVPTMKGDTILLRQAFFNLINNAIDYTKKGEIIVNLKRIKKIIIISIVDSGVGLTTRKLQMLFNTFERPYFSSGKGGFGLYIAGLVIKAHKGKLSAQSRKPRGLHVSCQLPLD